MISEDIPEDIADALITIFAAIYQASLTKRPVTINVLSAEMEDLVNEVTEEVSDVIPEALLVVAERETIH